MRRVLALAIVASFVAAPAFAQAGGPDLPGRAKTTKHAGKRMMMKKPAMKMKMSKSRGKMPGHKTF